MINSRGRGSRAMPRLFLSAAVWAAFAASAWADGIFAPAIAPQNDKAPVLDKGISFKRVEDSYDISGATGAELEAAMDKAGPKGNWAYTTWITSWSYDNDEKPESCGTANVRLSLRINMTLPKWAPGPDASDPRRKSWEAMLAALKAHEEGHANNGMRAANAMIDALRRIPPQKTCAELEPAVNELLQNWLKAYRKADKAYDRETRHGSKFMPELKW